MGKVECSLRHRRENPVTVTKQVTNVVDVTMIEINDKQIAQAVESRGMDWKSFVTVEEPSNTTVRREIKKSNQESRVIDRDQCCCCAN